MTVPDLTMSVDGRANGRKRKDAAHLLLAAQRERVLREAQRILLRRALIHGTATADDIRAEIFLPEGVDPVCLGAAPGPLAKLGIIRRIGFTESARPLAHARPVSVWELVDSASAIAWLASHPPIPSQEGEG